jgi:hypothetical protein
MVMPVMALSSSTMIPLFISAHRPFTKIQFVTTVNATNVLVVGLKKMKDQEKRKAHQRLSMKSVRIKSRISIARTNIYWCEPKLIGTGVWFQRSQGCSSCRRVFVNIGANMKLKLPWSVFKWPTLEQFDKEIAGYYREFHRSGKDSTRAVYDSYKKSLAEGGSSTQLCYDAEI